MDGTGKHFLLSRKAVGRVVDRLSTEAMLISRENEGVVAALAG